MVAEIVCGKLPGTDGRASSGIEAEPGVSQHLDKIVLATALCLSDDKLEVGNDIMPDDKVGLFYLCA